MTDTIDPARRPADPFDVTGKILTGTWAPKVRANVILPGAFDTDIADARGNESKANVAANPMGRTGQPDDLVGACLFPTSDASSYVNGAQLLLDGGLFRSL